MTLHTSPTISFFHYFRRMNSTTTFNYAAFLANVTVQFNRYVPIPLLILGMVGNVLNLFVLKRPLLRSNPCSVCFMAASSANILALFDGLLPRILLSFDKDPADTSDFFCKTKYYLIYSSCALSSWFIVLATIDRYLSSSRDPRKRGWSSLKQTRWRILGLSIFAAIFFVDKPVCFVANIPNEILKCNAMRGACRIYHDFSYIVVYSLMPCILLAVFGALTIGNIRKSRNGIAPQTPAQHTAYSQALVKNTTSRDRQLISMLLVQVMFLVLFSFPISIVRIYLTLTASISKTPLRLTQEGFAIQLVIMLTYIPIIDTFYIYVLWGQIFRKQLQSMLGSWMKTIGLRVVITDTQISLSNMPTVQQ
jgi:hypothetical protein